MFLSAASGVVFLGELTQSGQLAAAERLLYSNLRNSIVRVIEGSEAKGVAVLIDRTGLFMLHAAGEPASTITVKLSDGQTLPLNYLTRDLNSQLAVYASSAPIGSNMTPVSMCRTEPRNGTALLAALPTGAVRGIVARTDGYGVLNNSRRMVPLYEIRFEASAEQIGGAIVFTAKGELLSAVSAALRPAAASGNGLMQNAQANRTGTQALSPTMLYGPGSLAVAYVPSVELTRRVVDGFRSANHRVVHPALGVLCIDNPTGGALIQQVLSDSAAAMAGLRVNDVIVSMGNATVRNQLDFAKVMFKQTVGSRLSITVLRGGNTLNMNAIIGRQAD